MPRPLAAALLALLFWSAGSGQAPAQQGVAAEIAAAARTGGAVEVTQGVSGFSCRVSVPRGKTLRLWAATPVVLDGGGTQEIGLRVLSGGRVVIEGPITWRGFRRHALMVTTAEGLTIRGGVIENCGKDALLTGRTPNVRLEGLTARQNGFGPEHAGHVGHGLYISEGGNNHVVTGCTSTGNAGAGIQINANPYRSFGVRVERCDLRNNRTSGVLLAAVSDAVIADNETAGCREAVSAWHDGAGRKARCERVDLRRQAGKLNIHPSSRQVLLPAGRRAAH